MKGFPVLGPASYHSPSREQINNDPDKIALLRVPCENICHRLICNLTLLRFVFTGSNSNNVVGYVKNQQKHLG